MVVLSGHIWCPAIMLLVKRSSGGAGMEGQKRPPGASRLFSGVGRASHDRVLSTAIYLHWYTYSVLRPLMRPLQTPPQWPVGRYLCPEAGQWRGGLDEQFVQVLFFLVNY